jgi:hypothetical protein
MERLPKETHPEPAELLAFVRCEASRDVRRLIVRHLLAGCRDCTAVTRSIWFLGDGVAPAPDSVEGSLWPR